MSRRRVFLVHGWRVRDPMQSIGKLLDPLAALGYAPALLVYGYTLTPTRTKFLTRKKAMLWSARTQPGDVVIGHSNGCALAFEMSHHEQNRAETMVWINPALQPDIVPGRSVQRCLVLFNPFDETVRLAALLPDIIWGDMGRRGYLPDQADPFGRDERMSEAVHGHGHSDWGDCTGLANTIHRFIEERPLPALLDSRKEIA